MQKIYNFGIRKEAVMSAHVKFDEMSAYADGEEMDSEVLDAHFQTCAMCRDRLASLRAISLSVQELPQPDVHPAFAQRVLATIAEEESTRGRSGMLRWVYRLTPVAVAALLIVAVSLNGPVDAPDGTAIDLALEERTALILQQDEEALFDQLNVLFAAEESSDSIIAIAYHVSLSEPAATDPDLLTFALGDADDRALAGEQWPASTDLRTTIKHLNAGESNLLRQMLLVHAQEALLAHPSFEG